MVLTALALVRFYPDTLETFLVRLGVAAIARALFAVLILRERRRALARRLRHADGEPAAAETPGGPVPALET